VAVDTEEQAVKAARENLALNDAAGKIEVVHGSLDAVAKQGPYDFVLANINAATVIALAHGMFEALKPGREVVGGGIIGTREAQCVEALEDAGFEIVQVMADGDWRTIVARRPA
jgi:ribosomal protein L11 methyltransferase